MFFQMVYDDKLAQACYLIGCQRTGEALVIDPERDIERYIQLAAKNGLMITAIAETHIHADFLSGARALAECTGARLYLSGEGGEEWCYRWLDKKAGGKSYDRFLLKDSDTFKIGAIQIKALHTPGHTPEHLCYLITDEGGGATEPMGIASGDFVFVGDVGRPDLLETAVGLAGAKEASAKTLFHSIQRFKELPDFLQLWPGHGAGSACGKEMGAVPQSTVGYEKRFNAAIASTNDVERFVEDILYGQLEPPDYFARMKYLNQNDPPLGGQLPSPKAVEPDALSQLLSSGVVVIDTRPWSEFKKAHLKSALHASLDNDFTTIAGSYLEPEAEIYLVVEPSRVEEAVLGLFRIGLDRVAGYLTPDSLKKYLSSSRDQSSIEEIAVDEFQQRRKADDFFVLDVRSGLEFEMGHIPSALNIAYTQLRPRLKELPRDKTILVHCQKGDRSPAAAALLVHHGYRIAHLAQGFRSWLLAGGETSFS